MIFAHSPCPKSRYFLHSRMKRTLDDANRGTLCPPVLIGSCRACTCTQFTSSPLNNGICTCGHFTAAHLNPSGDRPGIRGPGTYRSSSSEILKHVNSGLSTPIPIYGAVPLRPSDRGTGSGASEKPKSSQYSAAEKEGMVNFLLENFPKVEPKVLYLALRHYHFNMNSFFEDYNTGKVSFIDLERRYLLEEYATVKNRLDELERTTNPKPPSPERPPEKEDTLLQESIDELNEKHAHSAREYIGTVIPKPSYWDLTKADFALIPVVLHSEEGLKVLQRFYENDQKSRQVFEIKSVVRVQNAKLFDHYYISQATLTKRNGKANERSLFHGCSAGVVQSIVSTGFDIRLSSFKGSAGAGIYFAQFPRTSLSYIRDCPPTEMKVLLCRVELGLATTIPELHKAFPFASPGNPIRRPHARSLADPTPFDSVHGNMRDDVNHPIHVVYDNYQVYPEYIITFSINENRIVRGKAPSQASAITFEHPRYRAQLEETKKSLKFLERTLQFEPNRGHPDYRLLERLHALLTAPPAAGSIHDTDHVTLEALQHLVRHYNFLSANYPVIVLPKESTFVELESAPIMGSAIAAANPTPRF